VLETFPMDSMPAAVPAITPVRITVRVRISEVGPIPPPAAVAFSVYSQRIGDSYIGLIGDRSSSGDITTGKAASVG